MRHYTYITPEQARYNAQHQEKWEALLHEVEDCIIQDSKRGAYYATYATNDYRGAEYVKEKMEQRGFKVTLGTDEDRGYGLPQMVIRVDWSEQ